MTDELERLREAMAATSPEPDPVARKRALGAALRAFDEESAAKAKGSAGADRHSRGRASLLGRLLGGRFMHITMPGLKPALMGGASVAVVAIAVLALRDLPRKEAVAPLPAAPEERLEAGIAAPGSGVTPRREVLAKTAAPKPRADGPVVLRDELGEVDSLRRSRQERVNEQAPAAAVGGVRAYEREAMPDMAAPQLYGQTESLGLLDDRRKADRPAQTVYRDQGRDRFAEIEANPVKVTAEEPVSTFSIDVDTASYAFVRRAIMQGVLPQKDAVRVEEMINYFPYDYPLPESRETPFRADVQVIPTPWNEGTRLMRIGIKGYALAEAEKPRANLVFLIDSSGSMNAPDKLPLLLNSFRLLIDSLDPEDTVAIVTYAGSAGTVLEPTPVAEAGKILAALERLHAGGSTAGAEGIRLAYRLAKQNFDAQGVNRVILATDGDFNVGITDMDELKGFIERKRETGVLLSVLGFGQGNLNDELMQALAQNGNGQAAYIDTLSEARKALVEEAGSTLFPIAKDVKIQIEFNPAMVAEYRLIGYETRMLRREDFNNDKVDAGEIGSGHAVTALYEITPVGSAARVMDDLRYRARSGAEPEASPGEYAYLKIRYKAPGGRVSRLIETPVTRMAEVEPGEDRARETRFAAAVAGFGQLLRGGRHMGDFSYDDVAALAQGAKGDDPFGYRAEFINLVRLAKSAAALEPLRR